LRTDFRVYILNGLYCSNITHLISYPTLCSEHRLIETVLESLKNKELVL